MEHGFKAEGLAQVGSGQISLAQIGAPQQRPRQEGIIWVRPLPACVAQTALCQDCVLPTVSFPEEGPEHGAIPSG